jgi:hypothetical protein
MARHPPATLLLRGERGQAADTVGDFELHDTSEPNAFGLGFGRGLIWITAGLMLLYSDPAGPNGLGLWWFAGERVHDAEPDEAYHSSLMLS